MLLFEIQRFYGHDHNQQPYLEILYKAMFSLAYYGLLRVGEITYSPHVLKACNIHVGHNKDKLQLVLYSSKTHCKESSPQKIKISAVKPANKTVQGYKPKTKTTNSHFCPVKLVTKYMGIRGSYQQLDKQFFIFADGTPVKDSNLRTTLRNLLNSLGLDGSLYDVHSFRIGRTSDLEKYGYSIDQIKAIGRWKSNAVYRYLKNH